MEKALNPNSRIDFHRVSMTDNSHQAINSEENVGSTMQTYDRVLRIEVANNGEQMGYLQERMQELYRVLTPIFGEVILAELERVNGIYQKEQSVPTDLQDFNTCSPVFQMLAEQIGQHRRQRDKVALLLTNIEYLITNAKHHI